MAEARRRSRCVRVARDQRHRASRCVAEGLAETTHSDGSRNMHLRLFGAALPRFGWRHRLRVLWYRTDKEVWVFAFVVGLIITILALTLRAVVAEQDQKQNLARLYHEQNLTCLAQNVY